MIRMSAALRQLQAPADCHLEIPGLSHLDFTRQSVITVKLSVYVKYLRLHLFYQLGLYQLGGPRLYIVALVLKLLKHEYIIG